MKLIMRPVGEPEFEPVTLGQLRDHVRADDGVDDAALIGFGVSARQWLAQYLGRPIIVQPVRGICEGWPASNTKSAGFDLSMPVNSVDSVFYTDADGVVTEWPAGEWVVRTSQGGTARVRAAANASWPTLGDDPVVTINATAGFASVPEPLVKAICLLAGYLHANRDGIGDRDMGVGSLPRDVRELARPWRWGGVLA